MITVIKRSVLIVGLTGSLLAADQAPTVELPHSFSDAIALGRFSMDRVAGAREYLTRRMRRIRGTINGTLITSALAIGGSIAWRVWKHRQQQQQEANESPEVGDFKIKRSLITGQADPVPAEGGDAAPAPQMVTAEQAEELLAEQRAALGEAPGADDAQFEQKMRRMNLIEARINNRAALLQRHVIRHQHRKENRLKEREDAREERRGDGIMDRAMSPVKWGLAIGLGGLILTTGQHALRVLSGTLEEALNLWWHGYMYWYNTLEQRTRSTMNELRDGLHQARKIAQSGVDAALLTRQMRHTSPGHIESTHYRADITMMYQMTVGMLERLVALMYIIAPEENHTAIYRNVKKMAQLINGYADQDGNHVWGLGDSLEHDLNVNSHGTLTHYSNKTIDLYHDVYEFTQIFLTTYRVYLKG